MSAAANRRQSAPIQDDAYRSSVLQSFWLRPSWLWLRPLPLLRMALEELGLR